MNEKDVPSLAKAWEEVDACREALREAWKLYGRKSRGPDLAVSVCQERLRDAVHALEKARELYWAEIRYQSMPKEKAIEWVKQWGLPHWMPQDDPELLAACPPHLRPQKWCLLADLMEEAARREKDEQKA